MGILGMLRGTDDAISEGASKAERTKKAWMEIPNSARRGLESVGEIATFGKFGSGPIAALVGLGVLWYVYENYVA